MCDVPTALAMPGQLGLHSGSGGGGGCSSSSSNHVSGRPALTARVARGGHCVSWCDQPASWMEATPSCMSPLQLGAAAPPPDHICCGATHHHSIPSPRHNQSSSTLCRRCHHHACSLPPPPHPPPPPSPYHHATIPCPCFAAILPLPLPPLLPPPAADAVRPAQNNREPKLPMPAHSLWWQKQT